MDGSLRWNNAIKTPGANETRTRLRWQQMFGGWLMAGLVLLAGAGLLQADGKVFGRPVQVKVEIPDQRALLHYSNGVERLVIDTAFVGEGDHFAWVVPVPSQPVIEPVSKHLFSKVDAAFQPEIIDRHPANWQVVLFFGGLIILGQYLKGRGEPWFFVTMAMSALLMAAIAIPNFVKARSTAMKGLSGVTVLERKTIGVYDTAIISGREGKAVADWLNQNSFFVPPEVPPILDAYAREGWVFCAARLDRATSSTKRSRPHPLAFTFATPKPVYPLRLTGAGNDHCRVELFVFGNQRAEIPGFKVELCLWQTEIPVSSNMRGAERARYRLKGAEAERWTLPATVGTKLSANLSAADMRQDAYIAWVPFQAHKPVFYSEKAARTRALNWLFGLGIGGTALAGFLRSRVSRGAYRKLLLYSWLAGAASGFGCYVTTTKTEVRYVYGINVCHYNLRQLDGAKEMWALENKKSTNDTPTFEGLFGTNKFIRWIPECPSKGIYHLEAMNERPWCTEHGELPD